MHLPRLAIALDAPGLDPVGHVLDELAGLPVLAKVGLSLFTAVGPSVVHHVRHAGLEVFLDLKLHDIPRQVALAVEAAARLDVAMLTVHVAGGRAMLEAAMAAARGRTRVIGVTVLTSLDDRDLVETGAVGSAAQIVAARLGLARACGLDGVVLSCHELGLAREAPTDFLRVVPGIRATPGGDDQRRTASAAEAVRAGASMLVVGRPILESRDPRAAAVALLAEIAQAAATLDTTAEA